MKQLNEENDLKINWWSW